MIFNFQQVARTYQEASDKKFFEKVRYWFTHDVQLKTLIKNCLKSKLGSCSEEENQFTNSNSKVGLSDVEKKTDVETVISERDEKTKDKEEKKEKQSKIEEEKYAKNKEKTNFEEGLNQLPKKFFIPYLILKSIKDDTELRKLKNSSRIFYVRDVKGDGNCLFRCLSVFLDGHEENHE